MANKISPAEVVVPAQPVAPAVCIRNHPNLTVNVNDLAETPDQFLKRILLKEEYVIAQFDCFYPTLLLPLWKILVLCILTMGFYIFVVAWRVFQRWLYNKKIFTPSLIEFHRGKLAVTNKGRMICWTLDIVQTRQKGSTGFSFFTCCFPNLCAPPVSYKVGGCSRIYSTRNIRQITQFYTSEGLLRHFCKNYRCGIEVTLDEFNHHSSNCRDSHILFTRPTSNYYARVTTWLSDRLCVLEQAVGATTNANVLTIVSGTLDQVHHQDLDEVMADLCRLHAKIIEILPTTMPDCFISNPSIEQGKCVLSAKHMLSGLETVHDDRSVELLSKWLPLLKDEYIINTLGCIHEITTADWFYIIITCGVYYFRHVRKQANDRAALVVTNKRVLCVDSNHADHAVDKDMSHVIIQCRSYFPGRVLGGYISSKNCQNLHAAILTESGVIQIHFPDQENVRQRCMPFAISTQLGKSRADGQVSFDGMPFPRGDANLSLEAPPATTGKFLGKPSEPVSTQDYDISRYEINRNLLPLLPGEQVIDWIHSKPTWQPYCASKYIVPTWTAFCGERTNYWCSEECMGESWFPFLPYLFTCGLRPFQKYNDFVVTNMTLLTFTRVKNNGACGLFGPLVRVSAYFWPCDGSSMICQTSDTFVVTWSPLEAMMGQQLEVFDEGQENFTRRLCKGTTCGELFCPIGTAKYTLSVDMGKYQFAVHGHQNNHNWNKDPQLGNQVYLLSSVQGLVEDKMKR